MTTSDSSALLEAALKLSPNVITQAQQQGASFFNRPGAAAYKDIIEYAMSPEGSAAVNAARQTKEATQTQQDAAYTEKRNAEITAQVAAQDAKALEQNTSPEAIAAGKAKYGATYGTAAWDPLAGQQIIQPDSYGPSKVSGDNLLTYINQHITSVDAKTGAPVDSQGNVLGTAADVNALKARADAEFNSNKANVLAQLQKQGGYYNVNWNTPNFSSSENLDNLASNLVRGGLTDIRNLGYNKDGQLIDTKSGNLIRADAGISYSNTGLNNTQTQGGAATDSFGTRGNENGTVEYLIKKDAQGNPVFVPKYTAPETPGGLLGLALKYGPAIVAATTGNPLAAGFAGLVSSASQPGANLGNILKNVGASYAGAELGGMASGAAQGAASGLNLGATGNAALGGAAQGATQTAVRGAVNGNFNLGDIALGGLAAGTSAGISNLLSPTQLPAGQAGPAAPSPYSTGVAALDKYLPGVIGRTTGAAISGQDIGTALINNVIGAAGNYAGQQAGSVLGGLTGSNTLDGLISSVGGNLAGQALTDYLHGILSPGATSAPKVAPKPVGTTLAQAAAPAVTNSLAGLFNSSVPSTPSAQPIQSAPSTTAVAPTTPAVNDQGNLLNYLALAGLAGSGSNQTTAPVAPQLANVNPMDLSWLTPTANKLYGNEVI